MATDLLQLDFVVKQVGLDKALTLTAKFEREIMKTVKAYQQGQITQDRYQKSLLNTKRQMAALTDENGKQVMSIHKANAHVQRFIATQGNLNKSLNANSAAMQQTKRNTNQLGVLFQQSGYQIGDFAVQVQSGTNVMVAFGQQATQLIGTFAMLAKSTAAIAVFSALGVIVPIATAIAGAFMRTAKSAEEAKDKVTGLTKTLRDFRQEQRALEQGITTDQLALVDRVNAIKELREEQLQLIKDLQTNSNASNIMNVDLSVAERLSALIGAAFDPSKQADAESTINTLNDLMDKALDQQRELQVKINTEYLKRIRSMEDANKLASIENKFGQDHVKYRNEVRRQAMNALNLEIQQAGVTELVAKRLRDRLNEEYNIIDAKADQDELDRLALARQEAIQNSYKSGLAVLQQMTSEVEKREAAVKRIKDAHEDQMGILRDQIKLLEIEDQFGKNSSEYRQESAKQARDAYKESREALGVKGNLLKREMELYDQLQASRKEAELNLNILKAQARTPIYEPLTQAQIEANKLNQELIDGFNTANDLRGELGEAAYEALRLAGVDMASGISEAQKAAAELAADLNISLAAAIAMKKEAAGEEIVMSQAVVKGRVADRYDVETLLGMGYTREYLTSIGKIKEETDKAKKATEDLRTAYEKAMMTAKEFADALDQQVLGAVDGVADAFSNFLQRGMKDFKSFVGSIKDMFIRLLADMAAMALKRQILIPIAAGFAGGFGSAAAGATTANLIAGGGMAGTLAAGASSFASGAMAGVQGFMGGGVSGYAATLSATAANAGVMATIGAAVPAIVAVAAIASLFGGSKPLVSAENMQRFNDALVMTGQEIEATGHEAMVTAKALADVAGGFKELTEKTKFFYENFYTEGERRADSAAKATDQLNKAFADLEMAVPKTHSEFRQLVEAQDLMTEEGRETYNALLDISGAFVTLNGTMQQAAERAATLRKQELALREARSLAQLQPFIGEEASAATLERLSAQVYSGNIKSLVDGVFQEIFEALTPDATQMGKITPYLEELTEQLEEVVKNLSATDDILRKYASGDIIGEIRKFTKQMQREIRYLVDFSGGTPEGIAFGVFNSVKRAAQDITRIAKEMSRDLGTIFTEFAAEFKVENVLDESRKVTDRIDELLSAFTATRDSLLSSYTKAVRAFDHAPNFDTTTRAGREAFEEAQQAGEALAEAQREIEKLTTTINTLSTSSRSFEQAVADKLVEPITEALTVYLPTALDNLPQDIKNTMGGLFAGITEGSLEGFQSAYVQLSELFTTNKISVDQFNDSFKIMEDVFRGNISLTDQYTTKQQTVIEKLSRAYEDFTSRLQNLLGVVQGGIDSLLGQATSANVVASRRGSQAYLRTVARTGEFDAGRLERAVGAVSGGDTTGFGSRQDFLRYVADTTNVLNAVKGTLEGQLDTLQMKQVKSILKIEETSTSSAESLQSIQSLLAEFLGVGGRVPSFAAGGYHSGGLRIVGERGPELEATGPSRIIPAGEFAVGGVSALRQEIAEMKDQLYNGLVQVAKYTRKSSETLNKFDYDGLPSDRGY